MLKGKLSSPEADKRLRNAIRETLFALFPGTVKIVSMEIRETELTPKGVSFVLHVNGMIVPKADDEAPKETPPA